MLEECTDSRPEYSEKIKPVNGNSDLHKNGGFKSDSKVHQIEMTRPLSRNITEESENVTELDKLLVKPPEDTGIDRVNASIKSGTVILKNCKASWKESSITNTLNLNLNLSKGVYCAVVGPVGSGKVIIITTIVLITTAVILRLIKCKGNNYSYVND